MDNKVIAIVVVAALAVAGIGTVFFLNNNSDSNDDTASVCDTWYATYTEYVRLDTLDIDHRNYMMEEKKVPLIIESTNNSILLGTWGGDRIYGSFFDNTFSFELKEYPFNTGSDKYPCYMEAHLKGDRIIMSGSLYDSEATECVAVISIQYTRQGTVPVGLIDMVDFDRNYTPQDREVYTEASIKKGEKESISGDSPELTFIKGIDMISVFRVFNDESVFVFVSTGYTQDGVALGFMIGKCFFEGGYHYLLGITSMYDNTFRISYEQDLGPGSKYVSTSTYKTDYSHGDGVDVKAINGTFDAHSKIYRSETDNENIDGKMTIKTVGSGIYICSEVTDGKQLKLLGTLNGSYSQGSVLIESGGYFEAQILKDRIHLTGVIYFENGKVTLFHCDIIF